MAENISAKTRKIRQKRVPKMDQKIIYQTISVKSPIVIVKLRHF